MREGIVVNKVKLIALTLLLLISACNRSQLQDQQVVASDETMTVQEDRKIAKTGNAAAFDSNGENMNQAGSELINHSSITNAQPINNLTVFRPAAVHLDRQNLAQKEYTRLMYIVGQMHHRQSGSAMNLDSSTQLIDHINGQLQHLSFSTPEVAALKKIELQILVKNRLLNEALLEPTGSKVQLLGGEIEGLEKVFKSKPKQFKAKYKI